MKLLLCVQTPVECCDSRYFSNSMSSFVSRYKQFCDELVCVCNIKEVAEPSSKQINSDGVKFVTTNKVNSISTMLFAEMANEKIISEAMQDVDACIIHVPSRLSSQVIKIAQRLNKPYMVVVVACVWDGLWNYDWRGKLIAPFSFLKSRGEIRDAKYALYVTQHFLQNRYPSKGKTIGCSNVRLFCFDDNVLRSRLDRISDLESTSRPTILSTLAAVDVPYKGQAYVIRAIAKLKKEGCNFEYHLAGGGSQTKLIDLAKRLGVESQVTFYGSLSHDKVVGILDKTDIYIQPSKQEGLPRALIEAMSRACPAIASNIAGIPELLDAQFLFEKGDVDAICDLLRSFTSKSMQEAAESNYKRSKLYEYSILEDRRNEFIRNFINEVVAR